MFGRHAKDILPAQAVSRYQRDAQAVPRFAMSEQAALARGRKTFEMDFLLDGLGILLVGSLVVRACLWGVAGVLCRRDEQAASWQRRSGPVVTAVTRPPCGGGAARSSHTRPPCGGWKMNSPGV